MENIRIKKINIEPKRKNKKKILALLGIGLVSAGVISGVGYGIYNAVSTRQEQINKQNNTFHQEQQALLLSVKKDAETLQDVIKGLEQQKQIDQNLVNTITDANSALKTKIAEQTKTIATLQKQIAVATAELNKLQAESTSLANTITQDHTTITTQDAEIKKLQNELKNDDAQIKQLESEIVALQQKLKNLQATNQQYESEITTNNKTLKKLQLTLSLIDNEINAKIQLINKDNSIISQLQNTINANNQTIQTLKNEIAGQTTNINAPVLTPEQIWQKQNGIATSHFGYLNGVLGVQFVLNNNLINSNTNNQITSADITLTVYTPTSTKESDTSVNVTYTSKTYTISTTDLTLPTGMSGYNFIPLSALYNSLKKSGAISSTTSFQPGDLFSISLSGVTISNAKLSYTSDTSISYNTPQYEYINPYITQTGATGLATSSQFYVTSYGTTSSNQYALYDLTNTNLIPNSNERVTLQSATITPYTLGKDGQATAGSPVNLTDVTQAGGLVYTPTNLDFNYIEVTSVTYIVSVVNLSNNPSDSFVPTYTTNTLKQTLTTNNKVNEWQFGIWKGQTAPSMTTPTSSTSSDSTNRSVSN